MSATLQLSPSQTLPDHGVEQLSGSSKSSGAAPEFEPMASVTDGISPDEAIIAYATEFNDLRALEEELGLLPGDIEDDRLAAMDRIWGRRKQLASILAEIEATTLRGLGAKASTVVDLNELEADEFGELRNSVAQDAVRLGLDHSEASSAPRSTLAAAWIEYQRLSPIVDRAYENAEEPARAEEIIAAHDAWTDECARLADEIGLAQLENAAAAIGKELSQIGATNRDGRARSIRGAAAPVIVGHELNREGDAELEAKVEAWVKLGLVIEEDMKRAASGSGEAPSTSTMEQFHALEIEIAIFPATTFRGIRLKALLFNGGETLRETIRTANDRSTPPIDAPARALALDLVELDGKVPQEWPFLGFKPPIDAVADEGANQSREAPNELTAWPNLLDRTPEQRLVDLNHEYERAIAFSLAVKRAESNGPKSRTDDDLQEVAQKHADRIFGEIKIAALSIPAHSIREVALKARILSHDKARYWDHCSDERDADIRFLIEDILALGGLDRIRRPDFSFGDILPDYDGPSRVPLMENDAAETPSREVAA